jgi:ABC-2 type transport system permease protein
MKNIKLKNILSEGTDDLFYIWKQEFKTTFRDQGVLIFFILVPILYPLLYGFIYTNEVVREIPALAVDHSHTSLSREYLRKVDATADVKIVAYCSNLEEAKQKLKEREAYGIIYIPSEFSDNIAKGIKAK